MNSMASQITNLMIVYSTVYSRADQRKHQSSASLAFVWGIYRGPVNSPHKWPVTRKIFPIDDFIMNQSHQRYIFFNWRSLAINRLRARDRLVSIGHLLQNICLTLSSDPFDDPWDTFNETGSMYKQKFDWTIRCPLQWHHNKHHGVSNHRHLDCLLSRLFRHTHTQNIKAPRHWHLWGESTNDQRITLTKGQ